MCKDGHPTTTAPGTAACPGQPEDPEGDTAGGGSPAVSWPMLLSLVIWRKSQFLQGPVHLAGKLESWGVIGAIHPGKLVHVKDDIYGASFLVDTGSSYSILPLLCFTSTHWPSTQVSWWPEDPLLGTPPPHRQFQRPAVTAGISSWRWWNSEF